MSSEPNTPPRQVILWSQGRTGCHLLERMLSKQPNTTYLWHPYANARFQVAPLVKEAADTGIIPSDMRGGYLEAIEQGNASWSAALKEAEARKQTLFIHEHPQFPISLDKLVSHLNSEWDKPFQNPPRNFTLVPDTIVLYPGTVPILTFRHPAYLVPHAYSGLRDAEHNPTDSDMKFVANLRWQRALYAWYIENSFSPIVVDAEDYMSRPEFVKKLCTEAGLDPEAAIFKWKRASEEERLALPPPARVLLKTLLDSEGLRPELAKVGNVDIEEEMKKWEREFGQQTAKLLREIVDASLEDYEFLKSKKLVL